MIHAIDVAISQLGVSEASGNNDGVPAERYMRGDELAWCAGFVLWCFMMSDDDPVWEDYDQSTVNDERMYWELRAVSTLMKWAHRREVFIEANVIPARNDVIFYGSRTGSDAGRGKHVGLVESVDATHIHTVEGNFGDKVTRRSIPIGFPEIAGYARFTLSAPAV